MTTEYKNAPVSGVIVEDEGDGVITALVSVTGIVDNVKDIIEPGAYKRTLGVRKPKGIWHHTWTEPIAKTLEAEELMPGDKRLPSHLPDGKAWPKEAGALRIKMEFNLNTPRGKQAYEDVKFFGPEQEWSIGYNVPTGGATKDSKTGIRHIKDIDLFEYSPVLFGAMPHARTMGGVKEAQLAFKDAMGVEYPELQARIEEWERMTTKDNTGGQPPAEIKPPVDDNTDVVDDDFDEDNLDDYAVDDDDDFEDEGDVPTKGLNPDTLRKAIGALQDLLSEVEANGDHQPPSEDNTDEKAVPISYIEAKATQFESLIHAVDSLDGVDDDLIAAAANIFDDAYNAGNTAAMEKAAESILTIMEKDDDEAKSADRAVLAQVMADMFAGVGKLGSEAKGTDFVHDRETWVLADVKSRGIGYPIPPNGAVVSRKSRQVALLAAMDDDDLVELGDYLEDTKADRALLRMVNTELDHRRNSDTKSQPEVESKDLVTVDLPNLKSLLDGLVK